jgi:hypothetical protein
VFVARGAALGFAAAFDGMPIYAARLVYVAVQMACVMAASVVIALMTFDAGRGLFENILRRLAILALLVVVPPIVESLVSSDGYPLSFVLPWAAAMTLAVGLGSHIGARFVR